MDKKIAWFIVLVLLLSWIITLAIKFFSLSQSPMTAVMIFPMVLAFIFILTSKKDKLSAIGWKLPSLKYFLISIVLPIIQMVLIISIAYSFSLITFNPQHIITNKPTPNIWLNLILCIPALFIPYILLTLPQFIIGWFNHLGEEIAWRGYLFRRLSFDRQNLIKAVFISGIVWWAWHVPMFWLSPVISKLKMWQMVLTVIFSFFALIGTAAMYSWVYIKSGSIWAPTIMHMFWNLYRGILSGRLADGSAGLFIGNLWLINGEGIIGMIVTSIMGVMFIFLLLKLQKNLNLKNFTFFFS
jgi:membrane protease YdiL (CAAX protease family)